MKELIIIIFSLSLLLISTIINAIVINDIIRKEKLIKKQKELIKNLIKFRKDQKRKEEKRK